jgi:hypothetical protein
MWESRRDFHRGWEGWEAGFMAFHAFHPLSFPWPHSRSAMLDKGTKPLSAMRRIRHKTPMVIGCQ